MDSRPLALYPIALLQLMREHVSTDNLPLGTATWAGVESSVFHVPAHRLLEALLNHAPSPDPIAREFLVELGKCGISVVKTLGSFCSSTWADLGDHPSKLNKCTTALPPMLQVTGQWQSTKNFRSQDPTSLDSPDLRPTTFRIWWSHVRTFLPSLNSKIHWCSAFPS